MPAVVRDERGQLVFLFAVSLFTLLLFVSLSINVGQAVVRRHQAQILADTGALTGAAVQAAGLNQMTRVNAASLRLFNVLQMRSRVGGYRKFRFPVLDTLAALISAGALKGSVDAEENPPKTPPKNKRPPRRKTFKLADIFGSILKRAVALAGIADDGLRDDDEAFERMEPWFAGFRAYIRGANIFWEFRARQTANRVTLANIGTLVGPKTFGRCNRGLISSPCMRPIVDPGLGDAWGGSKALFSSYTSWSKKQKKGKKGIKEWLETFRDPDKTFSALEKFNVPRLIPEFQNPDGDILIVRYWTDVTKPEKELFVASVTAFTALAAIPFVGPFSVKVAAAVNRTLRVLIPIEELLLRAAAQHWHDMRVTLHRKRAKKASDQFQYDTRFVYWVKLPTTTPAMRIFYPFSDLPEITAMAVAKPVGGNFGDYPKAENVGKGAPGISAITAALSKFGSAAQKILKPNAHLYSTSPYGTKTDKNAATRFAQEDKLITAVYDKAKLEAMGFDPKNPENLFWYVSPHHPYYEPRLVPMQKAYLKDTTIPGIGGGWRELFFGNAAEKRLIEFYQGAGTKK